LKCFVLLPVIYLNDESAFFILSLIVSFYTVKRSKFQNGSHFFKKFSGSRICHRDAVIQRIILNFSESLRLGGRFWILDSEHIVLAGVS
jgi:hypothetical protein